MVGFGYRFSLDDLPVREFPNPLDEALHMVGFNDVTNGGQCRVQMGTEGSVAAYIGSTLLGRSDPVVAPGGYHHFEAKAKIANAGGYIEVRINEVTALNLTGIDTQATANAEASQVVISESGTVTEYAQFGFMDIDDIFCWDDNASDPENTVVDWVGDKGCYYRKPIADTATSGFILNGSATAYGAIDDVPPNGTDYLDDATGAARTIVEVEALPGNISEVIAWMPVVYARKEDSGGVTMRSGVVVGTDESYGYDDSPSTGYAYLRPAPKTIDPSSGLAWDNVTVPDLLIERTA